MSSTRSFVRDGALYALPLLLSRGVGLLLLPVYTRELGPEGFGAIEMTAALVSVGLVLLSLEINQAQARLLPEAVDPSEATRLFVNSLVVSLAVGGVGLSSMFVLASRFGTGSSLPPELVAAFPWVSAYFISSLALQSVQTHVRFSGQAQLFGLVSLAVVSGTVASVAACVWTGGLSLSDYFLAQFIGASAGSLVGIAAVRMRAPTSSIGLDRVLLSTMLRFSTPLLISSIFIALAANAERIAVATLVSAEELGMLGVALRFGGLLTLAFTTLSTVLTPIVYRDHASEESRLLVRRVFDLTAICGLSLLAGSLLGARAIVDVVAGPGFSGASDYLFYVLLTSLVANAQIFFLGLSISKETKKIARISVVTGLCVLAGCFGLTYCFGVAGALAAGLTGAAFKLTLIARASEAHYPVGVRWRFWGTVFGSLLAGKLVADAAL